MARTCGRASRTICRKPAKPASPRWPAWPSASAWGAHCATSKGSEGSGVRDRGSGVGVGQISRPVPTAAELADKPLTVAELIDQAADYNPPQHTGDWQNFLDILPDRPKQPRDHSGAFSCA